MKFRKLHDVKMSVMFLCVTRRFLVSVLAGPHSTSLMGQSYGFLGQHHHAHSALRSVPSPDGERSAQPAQTVLSKPPPILRARVQPPPPPPSSLSLSLLQHHLSAVHHHRPTIHHGNQLVRILTSVRQTVSTCPGRRRQVPAESVYLLVVVASRVRDASDSPIHRGFPEVVSRSRCRFERTGWRSGARSTASGSAIERVALAGPGRDLWNHPMDSNMSTAAFMHRYEKKNIRSIHELHVYAPNATHACMKSVRAPPFIVRLGFLVVPSRGFQKAASVADRWARCYVVALIEAHGETFPYNRQNT